MAQKGSTNREIDEMRKVVMKSSYTSFAWDNIGRTTRNNGKNEKTFIADIDVLRMEEGVHQIDRLFQHMFVNVEVGRGLQ